MPIRHSAGCSSPLGQITNSGEIVHTGPTSCLSPQLPKDNWRTFGKFAIVYLTQGTGRYLDANGMDIAVQAGDLMLVFPNLPHRYGPLLLNEHWREIYLVFEGPIFEHWFDTNMLSEQQPIYQLHPISLWQRRISQVIDRHPPTSPHGATAEVCRLQQLLADVIAVSQISKQETQHQASWLSQARQLLEQGRSPQEASEKIGCAQATFRKKFTQLAGVSPARYQATRLIDHACELMHTANLTDKAIALQLGFCDEFHFSKRFKQITGLSPRAYRSQLP